MGSNESDANNHGVTPEHMDYLLSKTYFQNSDIITLAEKFNQLTTGGRITLDDFVHKLRFRSREVGELVYKVVDTDGNGYIDFDEFVMGLSLFLPKTDLDSKIKAFFKACCRMTEDYPEPVILRRDLYRIIEMSLVNNTFVCLSGDHLNILIEELFLTYSTDEIGMAYRQFRNMVIHAPGILSILEFDTDNITI